MSTGTTTHVRSQTYSVDTTTVHIRVLQPLDERIIGELNHIVVENIGVTQDESICQLRTVETTASTQRRTRSTPHGER